jgi:excisionase family DNA binding protein
MKTATKRRARARRVPSRPTTGRASRPGRFASVTRQVDIELPAEFKEDHSLEGTSVALVDVAKGRLRLRFVRPSLPEDQGTILTSSEEAALARGGVGPVSDDDIPVAQGRAAMEYDELLRSSLTIGEAARRLGVNASRIRQRLAERSLYGLKDGSRWLLPAFQFAPKGLVPGVSVVVRKLPPDIGAVTAARWFGSPNPDLCTRDDEETAMTPLQWLLGGNPPEAAAELAAAL